MIRERVLRWAQRYAAHHVNARGVVGPDFVVDTDGSPQLRRWYLLPRNRWANVYLHHFVRSDEDRALHDHMYANVSWVLGPGGYGEVTQAGRRAWYPASGLAATVVRHRRAGAVVARRPTTAHRIVLPTSEPVWSLFFGGPRVREWGFWCEHGWRHWKEFVSEFPGGNGKGRGCE